VTHTHDITPTTRQSTPPAASLSPVQAVSALLAAACTDPNPPTWLPAAVATVAGWHQQARAADDARIFDLTAQLSTLRRQARRHVVQAVTDGHIPRVGADQTLRGWGVDPLPQGFDVTFDIAIRLTTTASDTDHAWAHTHDMVLAALSTLSVAGRMSTDIHRGHVQPLADRTDTARRSQYTVTGTATVRVAVKATDASSACRRARRLLRDALADVPPGEVDIDVDGIHQHAVDRCDIPLDPDTD